MTGTGPAPASCSIATRRPDGTTAVEDGVRDGNDCVGQTTGRRAAVPPTANTDTVVAKGDRVRTPSATTELLARYGVTPAPFTLNGALTAPMDARGLITAPAVGRFDAAFQSFQPAGDRPAMMRAHYDALAAAQRFHPTNAGSVLPGAVPVAAPPQVANPQAPRTLDVAGFRALVSTGELHVSALAGNERLRTLASDSGYSYLERKGAGASRLVSRTVMGALNLDADTRRAFQRQGVAALTEAQRQTLRTAIADERMSELSRLAGRDGSIPASRADEVFSWVDRFDSDGRTGSIAMVTPAPNGRPATEARLTPSGEALQHLLGTHRRAVTVDESRFVAGFRNGTFDAEALRNLSTTNPELHRELDQSGMLRLLTDRLANGSSQLTVPQLRTLFRAVDRPDTNGSGDSFVSRFGVRSLGDALPFNVTPTERDAPTPSGRLVAGLNAIFRSNQAVDPDERGVSTFDPPRPDPNFQGDILAENTQRLSERATIDRDSFADYMRDARINIADISQADRAALALAGVPWATIEALAKPPAANNTIGGPNAEMARLYATLQGVQGGDRRQPLQLYRDQFSQTPTGRVVEILDRYVQRHDIRSAETMARDLASKSFNLSPEALGRRLPGDPLFTVPGTNLNVPNPLDILRRPHTVGDRLRAIAPGFDIDGFQRWVNADPERRQGRVAADEFYRRLAALPSTYNALDPRPGTISLGQSTLQGTERSTAGQVYDFMTQQGLLRANTVTPRAFTDLSAARQATPDEMTPINLAPSRLHYMRDVDDCFRRASEDMRDTGAARGATRASGRGTQDTQGHWMARSENERGQIGGNPDDFLTGQRYIDAALRNGNRVMVGVARNGGTDVNQDGITDHWFTIIGRDVDRQGRLRYIYSENASSRLKYVGHLYVDNNGMLFAPTNAEYTVGGGGYQVTTVRGLSGRDWADEFQQWTGRRPRGPRGGVQ